MIKTEITMNQRVVFSGRKGTVCPDTCNVCEPGEVLVMFDGATRVCRMRASALELIADE